MTWKSPKKKAAEIQRSAPWQGQRQLAVILFVLTVRPIVLAVAITVLTVTLVVPTVTIMLLMVTVLAVKLLPCCCLAVHQPSVAGVS